MALLVQIACAQRAVHTNSPVKMAEVVRVKTGKSAADGIWKCTFA